MTILNNNKTAVHIGPCLIKFKFTQEAKAIHGQFQEPQLQEGLIFLASDPPLRFLPPQPDDFSIPFPLRPSHFFFKCRHFWSIHIWVLFYKWCLVRISEYYACNSIDFCSFLSSKCYTMLMPFLRRNTPLFLTYLTSLEIYLSSFCSVKQNTNFVFLVTNLLNYHLYTFWFSILEFPWTVSKTNKLERR